MAKKLSDTAKSIRSEHTAVRAELKKEDAARHLDYQTAAADRQSKASRPPSGARKRKAVKEDAAARTNAMVYSSPAAASDAAQTRAALSGVFTTSPTDASTRIPTMPLNTPTGIRVKKGQPADTARTNIRPSMLPSELRAYDAGSPGQAAAIDNIMGSSSAADKLNFAQSVDAVNKRMIVSKHLDPVQVGDNAYMTRSDYWSTGRGRGSAPVSISARPTTHNSLPAHPASPYTQGGAPLRDATGRVIMSGGAGGFGAASRSVLEATQPGGPAQRANAISFLEHQHRAMFGGSVFPKERLTDTERREISHDPTLHRMHSMAESASGVSSDISGAASGKEDISAAIKEMNLIVGYGQGVGGMTRNLPLPDAKTGQLSKGYARQKAATEARAASRQRSIPAPQPLVQSKGMFTITDPHNIPRGTSERLASLGETAVVGPMKTWVDDSFKEQFAEKKAAEKAKMAEKNTDIAIKKKKTSESLGIGSIREGSESTERKQKAAKAAAKTRKKEGM
jgi:hypothetical protein